MDQHLCVRHWYLWKMLDFLLIDASEMSKRHHISLMQQGGVFTWLSLVWSSAQASSESAASLTSPSFRKKKV